MSVYELNMEGLVGPTHHFAGLAYGNTASSNNALTTSNPQAAALQGLTKIHTLHQLGVKQAIMIPHERPNLHLLKQLGFLGAPALQIKQAYRLAPEILSVCYSASSMWAANAATVSPSSDTKDGRVHFTAANLVCHLHRAQEASFTQKILKTVFPDPQYFIHHASIPPSWGDEGAANHMRLAKTHADFGVNIFVYGMQHHMQYGPRKYPARQSLESFQTIARQHQLDLPHVMYVRQNPKAIDRGVFHNDVIAVTNEAVILLHEQAFCAQKKWYTALERTSSFPLTWIKINAERLSLQEAVQTYLFNSQIITLPAGRMILVAPMQCKHHQKAKACIDRIIADQTNPITAVYYFDLNQSMNNGGGPACLRLRVVLNEYEFGIMHQGVLITDALLVMLRDWVLRHYRTQLNCSDLVDPNLIIETQCALDELTQILHLGSIYPFQKG